MVPPFLLRIPDHPEGTPGTKPEYSRTPPGTLCPAPQNQGLLLVGRATYRAWAWQRTENLSTVTGSEHRWVWVPADFTPCQHSPTPPQDPAASRGSAGAHRLNLLPLK